MLLQMIKAINTNKSTENVNLLDAMKILAECWYDVNEEIVSLNLAFHQKTKATHKMI